MLAVIENVSKRFENTKALDDVSLTIEPGQIVAALGLNGAGKTTLLRCLAGIVHPDSGRVVYDNEPFHRGRLDLRRRFFYMPDVPPYFDDATVISHISMILDLYPLEFDAALLEVVVELLRELNLLELIDRKIAELSRGQQYKTTLAALFAVAPELWILDEPLASGIDAGAIDLFKHKAAAAAKAGKTIIYSTQILDVVERFSDRVCILENGRVRAFDRPEQLLRDGRFAEGVLAHYRQSEPSR